MTAAMSSRRYRRGADPQVTGITRRPSPLPPGSNRGTVYGRGEGEGRHRLLPSEGQFGTRPATPVAYRTTRPGLAASWAILLPALLSACAAAQSPPGPNQVLIPTPSVTLRAEFVQPVTPALAPAVVLLHGCGGPFPARDNQWRDLLVAAGHPVLLPDSFGSRGLGSQCSVPNRAVTPAGARRGDAIAAAKWLQAQPGIPPGGVVIMGWSNGGSTVLAAARAGRDDLPPGLVRGFVAFYPGCTPYARQDAGQPAWAPAAPMLLLMGADDDWTPPGPCRALAGANPGRIQATFYPGAYHDFDAPGRPVRERHGLAFTANRNGVAHVGTDPAARADAMRQVPAFLAALPPAAP